MTISTWLQVSVLLVAFCTVFSLPLLEYIQEPAVSGSLRTVRSPKLHHLFGGGHHGGFGGGHGGHGGHHGGYGGNHGGPQGGYGGPHGGGNFAGSAAFAGNGGHGGHGGPSQSQSASFAFGPFSAAFSQSQAGGRGRYPDYYDY